MALGKLPLKPSAVYAVFKEVRSSSAAESPLVVAGAGARALVSALRRELVRGGAEEAVREGGTFERASALVYVIAGAVSETDERELRAAARARVPVVCVVAGPGPDGHLPYVLANEVVQVGPGSSLPLDEIARALARRLGEAGVPLAARLPSLRRAVRDELIARCARRNGVIGAAVFVPGADLPVLTLNQMRLVLRIAAVHGQPLDRRRAVELAGVLGGALGLRALARELLTLVPIAGFAVKSAVAYTGTRALGEAASRYFERLSAVSRDA